ncbi:methionyl-trna synthetase [Pseudoloma neurophilia]|uniref:methionine--tRNA ligase n=1 Tax=Pseudoloma neurophilia TaxID=146866 RepID=A0A0R0M893_9MICR|nr:methionyl-trna synthetase [Pseudoloma neurophilia]
MSQKDKMDSTNTEKKKILITAALPYVNNSPHLGNIIGSVLSADIYSRYIRKTHETIFICGTDDFGTATEITAKKANVSCQQVNKENKDVLLKVFQWFDLKFDYFGGTSELIKNCPILAGHSKETQILKNETAALEEEFKKVSISNEFKTAVAFSPHARVVQAIYNKIKDTRIEKDTMTQFYCSKCEMFLADRYLTGTCKKCNIFGVQGDQCDACGQLLKNEDILNPECTICKNEPHLKDTEHYFLKLQDFTNKIQSYYDLYSENWTKNATDITLTWLQKDLHNRCITRDLKWGVPVPGSDKVFYVWFDAVIGYISFFFCYVASLKNSHPKVTSFTDETCTSEEPAISIERTKSQIEGQSAILGSSNIVDGTDPTLWDDYDRLKKLFDSYELVQFMGKDNVPFHTIIFPVITDSIAKKLSVTEYLLFENKKFSKSKKIGLFGVDLIENEFGESDLWRYYLCKIRPENKDSNFSVDDFLLSISELQNNFCNLCNRVLQYIVKKNQSVVRYRSIENIKTDEQKTRDNQFITEISDFLEEYKSKMDAIELRNGLKICGKISQSCNIFLQESFSKKSDKLNVFSLVFSVIRLLSELYEPFTPSICKKLKEYCKIERISLNKLEIIHDHIIEKEIGLLMKPFDEETIAKFEKMRV